MGIEKNTAAKIHCFFFTQLGKLAKTVENVKLKISIIGLINYHFFGINVNESLFVLHLLTFILIGKDLIKLIKVGSLFENLLRNTGSPAVLVSKSIRNAKWQPNSQYEGKQISHLILADYFK